MTKDEALKMALEALKELVAQVEGRIFCMKHDHVSLQNARFAIARAKEELAPIEIKKELALQALHDENERLGLYKDAYAHSENECVRLQCVVCGTVYADGVPPKVAQPEQEPVGWFGYDQGTSIWFETNKGEDNSVPLYTTPPQPEQEHFALKHRIAELEGAVIGLQAQLAQPKQEPVRIMGFNCKCGRRMEVSAEQGVVPAPQRTWVGLTAVEILDALISVDEKTVRISPLLGRFACAIEAKLKEKNNG